MNGDHADFRSMLSCELTTRATAVSVSWVKGHAKKCDIVRGRTTELDKWGNDGADALAVAGAALHSVTVPVEIVEAAKQRKANAKCVQRMMIAVLKARLQSEQQHAAVHEDSGSRIGQDS